MEALTQRIPAVDGMAEPVLETVPAPLMGIAHCCLRRDPQRRCSAADIAARLRSNASSPISKVISNGPGPSTVRIPAASAKWRYILPVAVVALLAAALLIGPKLLNQHTDSQPAPAVSSGSSAGNSSAPAASPSSGTSSEQRSGAAKLEDAPAPSTAKPSA